MCGLILYLKEKTSWSGCSQNEQKGLITYSFGWGRVGVVTGLRGVRSREGVMVG